MIDDRLDPPGRPRRRSRRRRRACATASAPGRMPSWPPWATTKQPTLSSCAFVATTPIVVFSTASGLHRRRLGWRRRPVELAAVVDVADRVRRRRARSRRDRRRARSRCRARRDGRARGRATSRSSRRCRRRCDRAAPHRLAPRRRLRSPRPARAAPSRRRRDRSKSASVTTIGTGPAPVAKPDPCSAHQRITPSAAASPNAEPPVSTTASSRSTMRSGASRSNSRVAGAPPRTSPDAVVPSGNRITVQPVCASGCVQWPTRTPGMSVITLRPPRPQSE